MSDPPEPDPRLVRPAPTPAAVPDVLARRRARYEQARINALMWQLTRQVPVRRPGAPGDAGGWSWDAAGVPPAAGPDGPGARG